MPGPYTAAGGGVGGEGPSGYPLALRQWAAALIAVELPTALVSTTETEVSEFVLVPFAMVKGMVSEKLLPYGVDAELEYQVVKAVASEMVAVLLPLARVTPAAAVNVTVADTISREVAYPTTTILKPPLVGVTVTPCGMITGALLAIFSVVEGAGEGVTSMPAAVSFKVRVMVPDTVPVCTDGVAPLKVTWVELAGTVKPTVRPPVVKTTSWPSGDGESGAKAKVTVPVIGSG